MAIGCRGRIRTGVIEVIEPRELPLLHSAVCPFRGIPSMQYARLKAYPSFRTVRASAAPGYPIGLSIKKRIPPASCSVWDMSPPRCCRTGKKEGGVKKMNAGLGFIPHLHNAIITWDLYDIL